MKERRDSLIEPTWFTKYREAERLKDKRNLRRLARLEKRVNALFAGLAVITFLTPIAVSIIAGALHV